MKAYVLHGIADLRFEEIKKPELKSNEVLVEVQAAGICGSDIPRIFDTGTYQFPQIPGHEFAGIVVAAGAETDTAWIGKRVGIFPLIPCKQCDSCRKGLYEMCKNYSYLGSRADGGFSEYVAVPVWNLIELPEEVSFETAAMLEPMAVAVHAMRSIVPLKNETVVVQGLGTIGMLLVLFLMDAGIKELFVIGNKDFQKRMAENIGIPKERYFDIREGNITGSLKERLKNGANVFFDCVGKNDTISNGIESAAPAGRIQLIGNPASDMRFNKEIYWKILRNQLTIKGSWNSSYKHEKTDDWNYVLGRLREGAVQPERYITHKFLFAELAQGLQIMKKKQEDYMKIMIVKEK